jgi:hypothetical protein
MYSEVEVSIQGVYYGVPLGKIPDEGKGRKGSRHGEKSSCSSGSVTDLADPLGSSVARNGLSQFPPLKCVGRALPST